MLALLERSSGRRQSRRTMIELGLPLREILREIVGEARVVVLSAERRTKVRMLTSG